MAGAVRSGQADAVRVVGLDELRFALRALGAEMAGALGQTNKRAAQLVADAAVDKAQALGGVAAKVAPSIKAAAQARQAVITEGGDAYPMGLGAEFGAEQYRQFEPWRGNQWDPDAGGVGYFLHPAVRDTREQFEAEYLAAIDVLTKRAFPD